MAIEVICPNGHPLTVDASCAGRLGLCPVCKAPVKVPHTDNRPVSEDVALDFFATPTPGSASAKTFLSRGGPAGREETGKRPKKRCGQCKREVIASLSVCPYCHVRFAPASDDPIPTDAGSP